VDFDQPEAAGKLLVGYSADVEIILDGRENALRIPTAAIQEGGRVLRYDPDSGKLEERRIKAGLANWEYTEVLDGLAAGDRIVTSLDKDGVTAGAAVKPDDKTP
jgi:HlyD family secretion protein